MRARYEGHYGQPDDTLRTWNVETMCHDALFAVPLWADVSPPLLEPTGEHAFSDYQKRLFFSSEYVSPLSVNCPLAIRFP